MLREVYFSLIKIFTLRGDFFHARRYASKDNVRYGEAIAQLKEKASGSTWMCLQSHLYIIANFPLQIFRCDKSVEVT